MNEIRWIDKESKDSKGRMGKKWKRMHQGDFLMHLASSFYINIYYHEPLHDQPNNTHFPSKKMSNICPIIPFFPSGLLLIRPILYQFDLPNNINTILMLYFQKLPIIGIQCMRLYCRLLIEKDLYPPSIMKLEIGM